MFKKVCSFMKKAYNFIKDTIKSFVEEVLSVPSNEESMIENAVSAVYHDTKKAFSDSNSMRRLGAVIFIVGFGTAVAGAGFFVVSKFI